MIDRVGVSPQRAAVVERDWTKGSVTGNLLSLAWPIIVGSSFNTLGTTIDMVWVGKLGEASIAGVGVSGMVVQVGQTMTMGLYTGLRAMVARFVGAGDKQGANHVAQQALVVSVAFSLFMAAIGILFAEPILILLGLQPEVVAQGAPYLRINFVGMVTMSFRNMTEATMQASGDAKTPMWVAVFFRSFHLALCPFLVFGWWLFPRLGTSGAALTGVFSQGIGAAIGLWFLFSGRTRLRLTLRNFDFDLPVIWRFVKLGLPASVSGMERSFGQLFVTWFVVPFGTSAVAAHALLQRLDQFMHMPSQGLGIGAGVLAGQNLGAGKPQRAEKTGWFGAGLYTGIMLIGSLGVWFWAENMVRIFSTEPGLVEIGSAFLRIEIVSYMMMGFASVLQQCLNVAGDTLVVMAIVLVTMWAGQVPLAFFLSRFTSLGVYGVRWAIVSAMVMRALSYAIYFKLGRWKRKKV